MVPSEDYNNKLTRDFIRIKVKRSSVFTVSQDITEFKIMDSYPQDGGLVKLFGALLYRECAGNIVEGIVFFLSPGHGHDGVYTTLLNQQ